MALYRVLSYIETVSAPLQNQLSSDNPKLSEVKVFIKCLNDIHRLITQSNDGEDLRKISEAIVYIGKTLSTINESYINMLQHIYLSLNGYRLLANKQAKPVWVFPFPVASNNEVQDDNIKDWKEWYTPLRENNTAAVDWGRGISIKGMTKELMLEDMEGSETHTEDEVNEILQNFVADVCGYQAKDKPLLLTWLKNNGGQNINTFLHALLAKNYFSQDPLGIESPIIIEHHWYENKAGKICLSLDMGIRILAKNMDEVMRITSEAKGTFKDEMVKRDETVNDKYVFLLRSKTQIELDVVIDDKLNQKKVVPKMTSLCTYGYTNLLLSPERLYKHSIFEGLRSIFEMRRSG